LFNYSSIEDFRETSQSHLFYSVGKKPLERTRLMDTMNFETKFSSTEEGVFEGYASVFDKPIPHAFMGTDIIKPGAFARSLREKGTRGVKLLWQHDAAEPIGRWLELKEDTKGLHVRGQLILELPKAKEARTLMKAGVLDGLSIGFNTIPNRTTVDSKTSTRTLSELDLWEISLVTFPAQDIARVTDVKGNPAQWGAFMQELRTARALLRKGPLFPFPVHKSSRLAA
jgi:hypothetical protein